MSYPRTTVLRMTEQTALERIKQDLLGLADFAYERLRSRVEGLTDEEYFWEPAPGCWSVRPAGDGTFSFDGAGAGHVEPAPLTTIAWRMAHLIYLLAGERNATWIAVTPMGSLDRKGEPGIATEAIEQLEQSYALFRRHVAAADPDGLTQPMGPVAGIWGEDTRAAFVLHELDELIHHGAEVAALRDLYRAMRPHSSGT
jgi:DinB superfamily